VSLHKTRGIVLHKINYAESSVIVKVYTDLFGLQTYLLKGVRKKKPLISPSLLQHLSLLELVVYHKETADIQHIRELRPAYAFAHIPFDIRKSSLAIFINEVVYKALKEEEPNQELFEFLYTAIVLLDEVEDHLGTFHIWFCIQFSRFLGFFPNDNFDQNHAWFDLREGLYVNTPPIHQQYLSKELSQLLFHFTCLSPLTMADVTITVGQKKQLLVALMDYYRIHLQGFGEIKSRKILEQVLA